MIAMPLEACGVTAAAAIALTAAAERASLIVSGVEELGLRERPFGRNERRELLASTTVPILSLPSVAVLRPDQVLVATDLRPVALESLRSVVRLMGARGTIHLVHVLRPWEDEGSATDGLHAVAASIPSSDSLRILPTLLRGEVARSIQQFALHSRVDMVVVGAHGRARTAELLWATVPMELFRKAALPVLVVPSSEEGMHQH